MGRHPPGLVKRIRVYLSVYLPVSVCRSVCVLFIFSKRVADGGLRTGFQRPDGSVVEPSPEAVQRCADVADVVCDCGHLNSQEFWFTRNSVSLAGQEEKFCKGFFCDFGRGSGTIYAPPLSLGVVDG